MRHLISNLYWDWSSRKDKIAGRIHPNFNESGISTTATVHYYKRVIPGLFHKFQEDTFSCFIDSKTMAENMLLYGQHTQWISK